MPVKRKLGLPPAQKPLQRQRPVPYVTSRQSYGRSSEQIHRKRHGHEFYVDDQCIDCDLCRETAPANFTRNDDGGHSYVYKQPLTDEEATLCKEAMEGCPVEAIGADGV